MIVKPQRYVDYYFAISKWELAALEHYHELIEANLSQLIEARGLPTWDGDYSTSGQAVIAELHQQFVDNMLPSVLRVPLILSLWSVYEAALIEVADTLRMQMGIKYSVTAPLSEVPEEARKPWRNFLPRAKFYFEQELSLSLFASQRMEQEISELYRLRNTLAHGGRRGGCKPGEWEALSEWAKRQDGIELGNGYISMSSDFVRGRIASVHHAATHVISQARDVLHGLGVRR